MSSRFALIAAVAAALVFVLPGAAVAASPEYSLEGTCAVVKLHPDDVSMIASQTAALLAVETSGTVPVELVEVGGLEGSELSLAAVVLMVGAGVLVGVWARGHRW